MPDRRALGSQLFRLLLLAAGLAVPLLPLPLAALILLATTLAWLPYGPPRREKVVALLTMAVALGALALEWAGRREASTPPGEWAQDASGEYAALWQGLQAEAEAAARALDSPPANADERLNAFRRLSELVPDRGRGRRALLLLDPDGAPTAWSGEGLLHEPSSEEVPRSGRAFKASFTAVTFLAVEPLPSDRDARRPWRVVAGASFPADRLPFPGLSRALRWSLVQTPGEALRGMQVVPSTSPPFMVVERQAGRVTLPFPWTRRVVWGALAFSMLALAVMRSPGLTMRSAAGEDRGRLVTLVFAGVFAAGMAAGLSWTVIGLTLAGLAVALAGLAAWNREPSWWRSTTAWIVGRGAVAALLLLGAAWALQGRAEPIDLGSAVLLSAEAFGYRLALAAAAFGLICLAGRHRVGPAPHLPGDRWAWIGSGLLLLGASLCDIPFAALPLIAAGTAAASLYADRRRMGEGLALAAVALMAVLAAAGAWETAYRLALRRWSETVLLNKVTPPTQEEMQTLGIEIRGHFSRVDLAALVPRVPAGLERQDLAYALWRSSPLARPYSLSALVVVPLEGELSSFSFGMPLNQDRVDWSPERWRGLGLPLWEESPVYGEADLKLAGKPWGKARFWLMPRPGFELRDRRRLGEAEVGLLKGGPAADPVQELLNPAVYALYTESGIPSLSPWDETPRLSDKLRPSTGRGSAIVETPEGRARAYSHMTLGVWEVIYLPFLAPLNALERTANSVLGVLLILTLAAPPVLLLSLPRASFRALMGRALRSYSKRLIIVYTVLLLLPLLLLNAVLVRSMEERLSRQQRAAGEAALASAQQVLGERLLQLEPGYGVDTALGDRLLSDLSEIVHHELNLYWGSSVYSSSKHELFTAGLLPNRIPGEIYSRLAMLGYGLSARTNRVGSTPYLEIYAPLRPPGVAMGEERLFLSMPLLAQQEEAAAELGHLRRQGFQVTVGLFLLLVAVGTRLARNFTRPLTELIEGTRRIAGGATSVNLAPTELELAALVEAVDDMALRIAEGRERLVREKQVVDRMVENITSGVVSLDRERRVLMHNRVAGELLGVAVGEALDRVAEGEERLAPVAEFLRHAVERPWEMARQTVRLAEPGSGEREWSLVWVPVPGAGEPSALLVVEDATEVLRGQRLLAWAEMARIIAHEIKNPLTPIRLSTEHLREVYRSAPEQLDRVFERCTVNILSQVEELRSIASEFSTYSAILRIEPKPGDLTQAIEELVEGYRAAPPEGVSVELETDGPIPARFDAKLLGRAVRNLMENALRASAGGGRVTVRVERQDGHARISVLDEGPGVRPPENLPRIFDPYFSTHDTGTGLGLPIARRVVEEHGGTITARNRAERGLEVVITLPVERT